MLIAIENKIFEKYPEVQIGYLVAQVNVSKVDPFVEELKGGLHEHLKMQGMDPINYVTHPNISLWRKIYEEDFGVKIKTYRSSVEALLRRVITNKPLWTICNVVDLYNCCSILSLLPMGGYDLNKVSGEITIRYAHEGEMFKGLGQNEKTPTHPHHVVYADEKKILCWLWNHKDAEESCIDGDSKSVIFFIDGFDHNNVFAALQQLAENLKQIQCTPLESGILHRSIPCANLEKMS